MNDVDRETQAAELPATLVAARHRRGTRDIIIAAAFAIVALLATGLAAGGWLRVALTLPMILFIPGYLFLQAVLAGAERPAWFHALIAVGISPPLVGLLALLTAVVPGGFKATPITATVTAACIALAIIALIRRRTPWSLRGPEPASA